MIFKHAVVLLLAAATTASAEKLRLVLEPADEWHSAIERTDLLFFHVVNNDDFTYADDGCGTENGAWCYNPIDDDVYDEVCCRGLVVVDALSEFDGIEMIFQSPEGSEIPLQSLNEVHRILVEFQAKRVGPGSESLDCTNEILDLVPENPQLVGSDVDDLTNAFNKDNSFFSVTECEIFTRVEFSTDYTPFQGSISSLSWSINFPEDALLPSFDEWSYDSTGYSWIRTQDSVVSSATPSMVEIKQAMNRMEAKMDALLTQCGAGGTPPTGIERTGSFP